MPYVLKSVSIIAKQLFNELDPNMRDDNIVNITDEHIRLSGEIIRVLNNNLDRKKKKSIRKCKFYNMKNGCKHGKNCIYKHIH